MNIFITGEMRHGGGHGRGEFPGGRKINLRNVWWFLAVFASITVIVIYLDKAYCLIFKRRKQQEIFAASNSKIKK